MRERLLVMDWNQFDLHHLLWRPRLPVRRFFELYCETWRRTVLNLSGQKKWWRWLPQVRLRDIPRLARILSRTQRLMDPQHYLGQTAIGERAGVLPEAQPTPGAAGSAGRPADLLNADPRGR
jgi:hypothetical protein